MICERLHQKTPPRVSGEQKPKFQSDAGFLVIWVVLCVMPLAVGAQVANRIEAQGKGAVRVSDERELGYCQSGQTHCVRRSTILTLPLSEPLMNLSRYKKESQYRKEESEKILRQRLRSQSDHEARAYLEWESSFTMLCYMDERIMKLNEMDNLQHDIERLQDDRKKSVAKRQRIYSELDAKKAELLDEKSRLIAYELWLWKAMNPETRLSRAVLEDMRKRRKHNTHQPSSENKEIKIAQESVADARSRVQRLQADLKSLRDRLTLMEDQEIDIKAKLQVSRIRLDGLNESRNEWDLDNPPDSIRGPKSNR